MYKENYKQKNGRKKLDIRAENVQNEQNRVGEKNQVTMQLVITEKPSVAQAVSHVIGADERKDGYMEGGGYIVSWCVGHLAGLADATHYGDFKKWRYEDLPILPGHWETVISPDKKEQFETLKNFMHRTDVEALVCATDAGNEDVVMRNWQLAVDKLKEALKRNLEMRGGLAIDTIDNQEYLADAYEKISNEVGLMASDGYAKANDMAKRLMGENCLRSKMIEKKAGKVKELQEL